MVAVGEVENKVLSQFQSRVHSHLQGLHGAAQLLNLISLSSLKLVGKLKKLRSQAVKIERTHLRTRTFHFKTIRKMLALRNE
jgi:hypothetical protein